MTSPDPLHWQQVYENKGEAGVSWFQAAPERSLDLIRHYCPGHSQPVIDVGGGASRLVDHLLADGYRDLTVLDLADAALETSRTRLGERAPEVDWIAADVTQWQPPRRYALWHDRAVLHFLTEPDDRAAYRAALEAAVVPGGHAVIAGFAPDGPEKCSGLPVLRYDDSALTSLLGSRFSLVHQERERHVTPGGKEQPFTYFVVRYSG